jgi:hypothetical protein
MNDNKNSSGKNSRGFVSRFRSFRRQFREKLEKSSLAGKARAEGSRFSLWKTLSDEEALRQLPMTDLMFDSTSDYASSPLTDSLSFGSARDTQSFKPHPYFFIAKDEKIFRPSLTAGKRKPQRLGCWTLVEDTPLDYTGFVKCRFEYTPNAGQHTLSAPMEFAAPAAGGGITPLSACSKMFKILHPDKSLCL